MIQFTVLLILRSVSGHKISNNNNSGYHIRNDIHARWEIPDLEAEFSTDHLLPSRVKWLTRTYRQRDRRD